MILNMIEISPKGASLCNHVLLFFRVLRSSLSQAPFPHYSPVHVRALAGRPILSFNGLVTYYSIDTGHPARPRAFSCLIAFKVMHTIPLFL